MLLLDEHLKELRRCIRPGASRHNWSTLGVFDFIAKCNHSIGKFESLVHQIQKNANDIKDRLNSMESTNMFKEPEMKFEQLPSCKVTECSTDGIVPNQHMNVSPFVSTSVNAYRIVIGVRFPKIGAKIEEMW